MLDLIKKEEVDKILKPVPAFLKAAKEIKVKTKEDFERAGEGLIKITTEEKRIKGELKSVIGPIKESVKKVEGWFKPALDNLEEASDLLRDKICAYQTLVIKKAEDKQAEIAEKVNTGELSEAQAGSKIAKIDEKSNNKLFSEKGSVSFTTHRFVKVVDLSLIPLEYHLPNMVKINEAMLTNGVELPGCEIVVEQRPTIKTK